MFRRFSQSLLTSAATMIIAALSAVAEDAGFGPPISVPRDVTPAAPEKLPARNWVDQKMSPISLNQNSGV